MTTWVVLKGQLIRGEYQTAESALAAFDEILASEMPTEAVTVESRRVIASATPGVIVKRRVRTPRVAKVRRARKAKGEATP